MLLTIGSCRVCVLDARRSWAGGGAPCSWRCVCTHVWHENLSLGESDTLRATAEELWWCVEMQVSRSPISHHVYYQRDTYATSTRQSFFGKILIAIIEPDAIISVLLALHGRRDIGPLVSLGSTTGNRNERLSRLGRIHPATRLVAMAGVSKVCLGLCWRCPCSWCELEGVL